MKILKVKIKSVDGALVNAEIHYDIFSIDGLYMAMLDKTVNANAKFLGIKNQNIKNRTETGVVYTKFSQFVCVSTTQIHLSDKNIRMHFFVFNNLKKEDFKNANPPIVGEVEKLILEGMKLLKI